MPASVIPCPSQQFCVWRPPHLLQPSHVLPSVGFGFVVFVTQPESHKGVVPSVIVNNFTFRRFTLTALPCSPSRVLDWASRHGSPSVRPRSVFLAWPRLIIMRSCGLPDRLSFFSGRPQSPLPSVNEEGEFSQSACGQRAGGGWCALATAALLCIC